MASNKRQLPSIFDLTAPLSNDDVNVESVVPSSAKMSMMISPLFAIGAPKLKTNRRVIIFPSNKDANPREAAVTATTIKSGQPSSGFQSVDSSKRDAQTQINRLPADATNAAASNELPAPLLDSLIQANDIAIDLLSNLKEIFWYGQQITGFGRAESTDDA